MRLLIFLAILVTNVYAQTGMAKVNGLDIAFKSYGSKNTETILLISGTNGQLTMWPPVFCEKLVAKGYRVIVFDNRDIGLSTKFDHMGLPDWYAITKAIENNERPMLAYSLDDMSKDATALLDYLRIPRAHIVGVSMGGMIAQRAAYYGNAHVLSLTSIMAGGGQASYALIAKPELLARVPAAGAPNDTAAYLQREIISMKVLAGDKYPPDTKKITAYIRANIKRSYHPNGLVRQGAASLAGYYAGRTAELKTIKVPTLVIHGTNDPIVPVEAGRDVAATVPGARFELIDGLGHDLPEKLYDRIVELIVENAKRVQ
ncbi:MAG: alpha/beta hydrolase [Pedobacter sp.]|nr:MAG: alpha/beta hydrolase [Pedobacter sp.]